MIHLFTISFKLPHSKESIPSTTILHITIKIQFEIHLYLQIHDTLQIPSDNMLQVNPIFLLQIPKFIPCSVFFQIYQSQCVFF